MRASSDYGGDRDWAASGGLPAIQADRHRRLRSPRLWQLGSFGVKLTISCCPKCCGHPPLENWGGFVTVFGDFLLGRSRFASIITGAQARSGSGSAISNSRQERTSLARIFLSPGLTGQVPLNGLPALILRGNSRSCVRVVARSKDNSAQRAPAAGDGSHLSSPAAES